MCEGPFHIDLKTRKLNAKAEDNYAYHVRTYFHQSVFGFKDIIPMWKDERWNPEELIKLTKKTTKHYCPEI